MLDLTVIAVSLSLVFVFWVFLVLLFLVGWLVFGWLIGLFTSLGDFFFKRKLPDSKSLLSHAGYT